MLCMLFPEGPTIRVLLVGIDNAEPGSGPIKQARPKNQQVFEGEGETRDFVSNSCNLI